jgi:hypothetical protein
MLPLWGEPPGPLSLGQIHLAEPLPGGYLPRVHSRPDLANGFANNGLGQRRIELDQAIASVPCERAYTTTTDWSG